MLKCKPVGNVLAGKIIAMDPAKKTVTVGAHTNDPKAEVVTASDDFFMGRAPDLFDYLVKTGNGTFIHVTEAEFKALFVTV